MKEWKRIAINLYAQQNIKNIESIKKSLKLMGYDIKTNYIRGVIYNNKPKKKSKQDTVTPNTYYNKHHVDWSGFTKLTLGLVSDTHLGSNHQQITMLNEVYDVFKSRGIDTVYHAGDLTEGFKMRAGHEHEIFLMGADKQAEYVIKNYPKIDGITTKFILGNHDLSHMKTGGTDIGKRIAEQRSDMIYLGALNSVVYITPNTIMEINHPLDGASYALSYAIQKMADSYSGDAKPNILINGHHHKMLYGFYRNIHLIEAGTFEAQTPWMRGKRISAHMGGMILHITVDELGTIKSFMPEFLPYYKALENDY